MCILPLLLAKPAIVENQWSTREEKWNENFFG